MVVGGVASGRGGLPFGIVRPRILREGWGIAGARFAERGLLFGGLSEGLAPQASRAASGPRVRTRSERERSRRREPRVVVAVVGASGRVGRVAESEAAWALAGVGVGSPGAGWC